jgi:hypothetical protein
VTIGEKYFLKVVFALVDSSVRGLTAILCVVPRKGAR